MAGRTQTRAKSPRRAEATEPSTAIVPFDPKKRALELAAALDERREQIIAFLGRDPAYAERFLTVSIDAIVRDRSLLSADLFSLVSAVRHAAIMGLEPTSVMGEGAIVVYRDSDQGNKRIAQFQPMVRGLAKLARNSGEVAAIGVDVVHKNDAFNYQSGSDPKIEHRPFIGGDPGEVIGAYAYARLRSGELVPMFMSTAQINQRRAVSKSFRQSGEASIWGTWPEEMMKKTVLRRLLVEKVPLSFRAQRALALDAEIDTIGGKPEAVEAIPALPGRTRARAFLDEPETQQEALQEPADDVVTSDTRAEPGAAPEPSTAVTGDAGGQVEVSGTARPVVCGKPGLREGSACQKPPGHSPPHADDHGEWL